MIHVAIIGVGSIAEVHIEALLQFQERCKIVALCSRTRERTLEVKERFHLDCEVFDTYESLIKSNLTIDLVHICTPPYTHAEIAIACMKAGKHIVVEKPMAASISECDQMLQVQKESHVILSCISQNRFRNSIHRLKKTLDSGLAGKLRFSQVNSLWWRGHSYYDLWWRGTWEMEGGGCTLNHAVHHIDLLCYLTDSMPREVIAMLANLMHDNSQTEDLSLAALRYEDGSVAQITSSVVHHGQEQGLILQCENAVICEPWGVKAELSAPNGFPVQEGNKELVDRIERFHASIPDLLYEGHTGQIENVLTAIETDTEPMVTGEDGKRALELVTAIYKAGFLKRQITLPIEPEDEFYTTEFQRNLTNLKN